MKECRRSSTSSYFKYLWESQQLFDFIYLCFFLFCICFFLSIFISCCCHFEKGNGDTSHVNNTEDDNDGDDFVVDNDSE